MRVLICHNYYQQPGGEDVCFESEAALLERKGHSVHRYTLTNDLIRFMCGFRAAARAVWSQSAYRELQCAVRRGGVQVVHFHNTFPLISPAAYYAVRRQGARVVQTVHNYRLGCPNALLFRNGEVCEKCLGKKFAWPAVAHACYRNSVAATGTVAIMLAVHRLLRTWSTLVDIYVTLTEFAREKLIEAGVAPAKIVVKPNFVFPDPGPGLGRGGYALFAGRLVAEKGIDTVLSAWDKLPVKPPLRIAGDGPLAPQVAALAEREKNVVFLGRVSRAELLSLMQEAVVLVFPSKWYEGFPMLVAEAYATGLPVVASPIGSLKSLVHDGRTGLHFRPGDAQDLASRIEWVFSHRREVSNMRAQARQEFEASYTAGRNYELLIDIYERALGAR